MTIVAPAKPISPPYGRCFAQGSLVAPFQRARRVHEEADDTHGGGGKAKPFGGLTYDRSDDKHR